MAQTLLDGNQSSQYLSNGTAATLVGANRPHHKIQKIYLNKLMGKDSRPSKLKRDGPHMLRNNNGLSNEKMNGSKYPTVGK